VEEEEEEEGIMHSTTTEIMHGNAMHVAA